MLCSHIQSVLGCCLFSCEFLADSGTQLNATENELQIEDLLDVLGDTILGSSSSDYCTLNCAASFTGPSSFIGPSNFTGAAGFAGPVNMLGLSLLPTSPSVATFQRRLGNGPVVNGTVLGQLLFTGWDGAANGIGAAIRSVYMVGLCAAIAAEQNREEIKEHTTPFRLEESPAADVAYQCWELPLCMPVLRHLMCGHVAADGVQNFHHAMMSQYSQDVNEICTHTSLLHTRTYVIGPCLQCRMLEEQACMVQAWC